jgi:hypothetical protein
MAGKDLSDYGEQVTARCERVLGSVLRGIGAPWRDRVCLVGGLVPRYLLPGVVDPLTGAHVGSTDVDMALGLAFEGHPGGAYRTLENNLKRAGLARYKGSSWQWSIEVDGHVVVLELLGDDSATPSGTLFRPKVTPPAGSGNLELLCVRGVELALRDAVLIEREMQLLDGAYSTVEIRVAGLAPFVMLKAAAYLDRRVAKDVYDLLFVLRNWPGGPREAALVIAGSPIATEELLLESLGRLAGDFASANHAGPRDYEGFVAPGPRSPDAAALRDEALLIWYEFNSAFSPPRS